MSLEVLCGWAQGPPPCHMLSEGLFFPQAICKEHGEILLEPKQTKAAGRLDPYCLCGYARCLPSPLKLAYGMDTISHPSARGHS